MTHARAEPATPHLKLTHGSRELICGLLSYAAANADVAADGQGSSLVVAMVRFLMIGETNA